MSRGLADTSIIPLDDKVKEAFATNEPFFVLLRPDNYIGLISAEFSPDLIVKYLNNLS